MLANAHSQSLNGLCVPSTIEYFDIPGASIKVDSVQLEALKKNPLVFADDALHGNEYVLEVQLPFLHQVLQSFQITPILVGEVAESKLDQLLELYLNQEKTLIIISSDLSHYLTHQEASYIDRLSMQAIESLDAESLTPFHACGSTLIQSLCRLAPEYHLNPLTLSVQNSYQTTHLNPQRVVGYGAFLFY